MATKPNAERVYQVITKILQRRYDINIEYVLESPGPSGHFFSDLCYENATNTEGENHERNHH